MTRLGFVRRAILAERNAASSAAWALLALVAPILLRMSLEPWFGGLPFLTFFPPLLLAATFLGWRWGGVVLVLAAVAANFLFQTPRMAFALSPTDLIATAGFLVAGALIVSAAEGMRRAVIELDVASRREAELNLELQHRVNNNMAVVQALARQTARHAQSVEAFYSAFSERLQAIAEANKILSRSPWELAQLPELAEIAVRPFLERGTIVLNGPPCQLPTNACVPLVLVLHELGTNATKYGSLSTTSGCVRLAWRLDDDRCRLTWREENGPAVTRPTRQGLGSRLLRAQTGIDRIAVDYSPEGVVCEIDVFGARPANA